MIKVLFFGQLKEQLDCKETTIEIDSQITIAEIKQHLSERSDKWASLLADGKVLAAINHTMSSSHDVVNQGDEVAFFPPVTGG